MALAVFSISGWGLLIPAIIILIVAVITLLVSIDNDSEGGAWASIAVIALAIVAMVFGGVGIGESNSANPVLPDFSKRCRGGIELSTFKTNRREGDLEYIRKAIEDDLGCKDAVEEVIQNPFLSPYTEASQLEPPAVELVPQGTSLLPGGTNSNGGVTAPGSP